MASEITLARPYAKAVFSYAVDADKVAYWSDVLTALAVVFKQHDIRMLLLDPAVGEKRMVEVLSKHAGLQDLAVHRFLSSLAHYKRLALLPLVAELYATLRETHEKKLYVRLLTARDISGSWQKNIANALEKRFGKAVVVKHEIDEGIIGGALVYVHDQVFDASIRGSLDALHRVLV